MKKIQTSYSKKYLNPRYYGEIKIENQQSDSNIEPGYVLCPFLIKTVSGPSKEYKKFI